ncbi:MAG: DUF1573 domain-containing protein [Betaproteobacteria bacterium]|nr:DUF1573 domain-containing protein [Betaproteobacteria bacterium]MDH3436176.1 DUF1573 domain-containing protein [Betaproteobacteria bacterium]
MSRPNNRRNILYALVAGTVVVIALGIFVPQKKPSGGWVPYDEARPAVAQFSGARVLTSDAPSFDFGRISMAKGKVSHRYSIRNSGATPLTITKIFTSCMCTTATLITPSAKKGPFGMPGHGWLASVSELLAPEELAQVDVVFDPAAHGPAGVGPTARTVTVLNDAGLALELRFNAMVTP